MIVVGQDEAMEVATEKKRGKIFSHGGDPLPIRDVEFRCDRGRPIIIDGVIQVTWGFELGPHSSQHRDTTVGIPVRDLRVWCAERHGCPEAEILFWFEA